MEITNFLIGRRDDIQYILDEAMEELEMNGWTCDQGNCVCSGDYPDCEHQAWLNDPANGIVEEEMDSDETDAEESDEEMAIWFEDESSDEEMLSDESGYFDEVGH